MSTKTTNFEFIKPEKTDPADITATNENWDKIDAALINRDKDLSMNHHRITDVAEPVNGSDVATRNFVEQHSIEGNTYVAVDYNKDGNLVLKPYIADEDELTFKNHIANKNNPHNVTKEQLGAIGYKRVLTADDDLDKLTEEGIYRYYTGDIPSNCPYANAGVVEVIKTGSNASGVIQRVTRYGEPGYSKQRILDNNSKWTEWTIIPLMLKKTYEVITNENGNGNTSIPTEGYIILSISARNKNAAETDETKETYICHVYKSTKAGGRWHVNINNVTTKENVANTEFTLTIYYAAV